MSREEHHHCVAGMVLVFALGLVSVGHAQMGGGMVNIPGTTFGGATDPSALQPTDGFRVIPSIMAGQRYDSNVFFVPKTPGFNSEDLVTTMIPQVRGLYAGKLATVNAVVGVTGEYYAKNSGINYVAPNAGVSLDLSKLASRFWEGTRLTVGDSYRYTPQPAAFLTGDLSGEEPNPFARGFQTGRVNMHSNSLSINLMVPLNQVVSVTGSYGDNFVKFGSSEGQQPGSSLNTRVQTYMAGLSATVSRQDTVSLNLINSESDYGEPGTFTARGGTVGWSRLFTPTVSLTSAAGAQVVEASFSGAPSNSTVAPLGSLAIFWRDPTTSMTVAYNIGVTPSFQFQSQALLTHVASVSLTQQTAIPELLVIAGLNYGRGGKFGGSSSSTSGLSYTTYAGIGGVTYRFTPKTYVGLTYSYSNYDQSFGVESFRFDRQVVQMTLTQAFY